MSLDTSSLLSADDLFVGKTAPVHHYHKVNNALGMGDGKRKMYDAMEKLILKYAQPSVNLRFMSLPGKFWRFEMRLLNSWYRHHSKTVYFTAFERDENIILSGAGYAPHLSSCNHTKLRHPGFRKAESLGVTYFKTNRARWLHLDVNHALVLNDAMFIKKLSTVKELKHDTSMEWWLRKFCRWDAVWLDYYGPVSETIGKALPNIHYHCRQDCVPVGVTVLKGRELEDMKVPDRRRWLKDKLGGGGMWPHIEFKETDYFEYTDGESTMCNILGVLLSRKIDP